MSEVRLILGDCLDVLPTLSGVDAVVTDPPYGLKWSGTGFKKQTRINDAEVSRWDKRPSSETLLAIKDSAKNVIVWGGNYFASTLGDCPAPLVWDKMTGANTFADGEMAWTSFKTGTLRIFRHQWCGCFKDSERDLLNSHPTQKPVALMRWCLSFLPEGCTVLDPYMGSGTTGVACVQTGKNFIGIEIDPTYFAIAQKRIEAAQNAAPLFEAPKAVQAEMFAGAV